MICEFLNSIVAVKKVESGLIRKRMVSQGTLYMFFTRWTVIAGTNKFASQKGMSMGAVRHVADIRADDMTQEGQGNIGLQAGTNKFATQSGMSFGKGRGVSDIKITRVIDDQDLMI